MKEHVELVLFESPNKTMSIITELKNAKSWIDSFEMVGIFRGELEFQPASESDLSELSKSKKADLERKMQQLDEQKEKLMKELEGL